MTLNIRSNISLISISIVIVSKIAVRFVLPQVLLTPRAILRQVHRKTPNNVEHTRSKVPKYVLLVLTSSKFRSLLFYGQLSSVMGYPV